MTAKANHLFRPILLLTIGLIASVFSSSAMAAPQTPANLTITNTVVAEDIQPLGVNLSTITGGTNLVTNNLIWGSGMEPAVARYLIRVERAGTDWIEWDHDGGVHMWDMNANGFGDDASIRFYRIVDAAGQPLSYSNGTEMQNNAGADHVIFLGETVVPVNGWVANGSGGPTNRVYLENNALGLVYGDHAIITVTKNRIDASEVHPRLHEWFDPNVNILGASSNNLTTALVAHPGTIPVAFTEPGDTCLQITTPAGGGWLGQWNLHGYDDGEGQWYSQLEPGASYRAEVWLRQEGIPGGQLRFYASGPYAGLTQTTPWTVTGQWQRFTYDFSGPPYPDPNQMHAALGIQILDGPGTVWLDNFMVYRNDAAHGYAPFKPHEIAMNELMAVMPPSGPKPAVRFYATTYNGHSPMKRLLSNYASSAIDFIYNVQAAGQVMTIPQVMNWAMATGDSAADRVVPHITLSEEYTEVEWMQLVEYLGVPYNPTEDTLSDRPWAYLRSLQRGNGSPWTDEFREIVIEFGNETWHAGAGGYGWHGFGRPGWVFHGGLEYGLFARYYFGECVAGQPWWTTYNLKDKIKFSLNADYDGSAQSYGEISVQQLPALPLYLGHANYVGPTWETGDTPFQAFDAHGMQETLVGAYTGMYDLIETAAATQQQLTAQGLADYQIIAYEGGPSGYYVPGMGTPEQEAISELYGKSTGMAAAAMDVWLYSSLHGYHHQEYFSYRSGSHWSSHTMPRAGGFRRHTGWLALMMRNLYAKGSHMLQTTFSSVPTYTREGEEIPLMAAYTIRDEDSLSLVVISRQMPGIHDGADFGDGITPVEVQLPFTQCHAVTRYALTAPDGTAVDPGTSNIAGPNVAITSVDIEPSICNDGTLVIGPDNGGENGGMAPGTIYLYVFQLTPQMVYVSQANNSCAGHTPCYGTLQQGVDDPAGNNFTVAITQSVYNENVILDRNQCVCRLAGGYADTFDSRNGNSTLNGNLTIERGQVILENIVIAGP